MEHPDRQLLIDAADGLLPPSALSALRVHLDSCPDCLSLSEEEAAFSNLLRSQTLSDTTPGFDRAVLDAILPATAGKRGRDILLRKYAGLVLLCMVTLFVVVLSMGQKSDAQGWMAPVSRSISSLSNGITLGVTRGIEQLYASVKTTAGSDSVLHVFALAVLALLLLGGLDRIISPILRKER